jgi:hypothetical protein
MTGHLEQAHVHHEAVPVRRVGLLRVELAPLGGKRHLRDREDCVADMAGSTKTMCREPICRTTGTGEQPKWRQLGLVGLLLDRYPRPPLRHLRVEVQVSQPQCNLRSPSAINNSPRYQQMAGRSLDHWLQDLGFKTERGAALLEDLPMDIKIRIFRELLPGCPVLRAVRRQSSLEVGWGPGFVHFHSPNRRGP